MRREVYLELAVGWSQASAHLGIIPTLDPTITNIGDGLTPYLSAAAKVQLVCEAATATKISDLSLTYMKALFATINLAQPVHNLRIDQQINDQQAKKWLAEIERLNALINGLDESGRQDLELRRSLQESREHWVDVWKKVAAERAEIDNGLLVAHRAYSQGLQPIMRSVAEALIPVQVALRQELEGDADIDAYRADLESRLPEMEKALTDAVACFTSDEASASGTRLPVESGVS